MWGVGGMQVHGICSHRLVYREVVETLSNYKKSYFWWYWNPACSDSTRSNRIGKDQGRVSARLVWGKMGEWSVWFSAFGAPLNDWANGGNVDVLFTCGECGFSSFGSWSTHSNFLHSSRSVIQQEIFQKIVHIVYTWDQTNFYLYLETTDT